VATSVVGESTKLIQRGGINYEVDLAEGIDLSLFLFGSFQRHISHNSLIKLLPDAVVLDVGANFGIMTTIFAQACPDGKVYAFEPTHYAIARLKRNLELNPDLAARVEVINSFVSKGEATAASNIAFSSWRVDGQRTGKEHPVHLGTPHAAAGVQTISLDRFCTERRLQRVDLIKIDTDGHEHEVLLGARETIRRHRPLVLFEVGEYLMVENGIDFSFHCDYFSELNYNLFDSKKGRLVDLNNYCRYVPARGTTDLLALPKEQ
jgi:FkbM family methyltransferase